jgi:hypothetical protein
MRLHYKVTQTIPVYNGIVHFATAACGAERYGRGRPQLTRCWQEVDCKACQRSDAWQTAARQGPYVMTDEDYDVL